MPPHLLRESRLAPASASSLCTVADFSPSRQRECIRQYIESALEYQPQCPVCNLPVSIDLDQEAIEQDTTGRQGILGRLDPSKVRTSTKIEAL